RPAHGVADKVRCIEYRSNCTECVDHSATLAVDDGEVRREPPAREVLLGRERTLSQIERDVLMEATEVVIGLRLAFTKWINCHAEARRPIVGEDVIETFARQSRTADHTLLLPAIAEQRRNEAIDLPRVLCVSSVILRLGVERWRAEFTAILAQVNALIH